MKYFDFFDRVKAWVKEHNTTIEALLKDATDGKVTKGVYQGWRTRETLPSGEYCYDLAKKMGVSCDWLISGEMYQSRPTDLARMPTENNRVHGESNFISSTLEDIVKDLKILNGDDLWQAGIYIRALADKERFKTKNREVTA